MSIIRAGVVSGGVTSKGVITGGLLLDIDTIVVFGASIMEQSFGEFNFEQLASDAFASNSVDVAVHSRATSGDNTTQMIAKLPAIISEFSASAANTLFVIHWAGNDISQLGPYPGGATTIDTNCRAMCQDIIDAGFKIAMSNTTYRIPPASNPTAPYNLNIMDSVIADFAIIPMDLYDLTINNQVTWYEGDGIHPSTAGKDMNRVYVADTCSPLLIKASELLVDVVLQLGDNGVYPAGNNSAVTNETISLNRNVDLSLVADSQFTTSGIEGAAAQGRGNVSNPSDTSISLTNNNGLSSYVYKTSGTVSVDVSLLGIDTAATYTVGVTASRDTLDPNRDCDILVGGVTKTLNAAASPAEIVEFTGVTGSELISTGITSSPSSTFTFAYMSMIRITKE